ncbi:hypothetical protein [Sphaerimonospora thailandensis]|uniref:hypothetical protein n=1 Tax=Sphaerimonospora thailandensis TaxID=795644 RepID=UPI001951B615|nr:hypothetical protein [Sphaerimonospora thailandensis]
MRQLIACLRARHWPKVYRSPRATICLRCLPCRTCGSTSPACVGWCVTVRRPT